MKISIKRIFYLLMKPRGFTLVEMSIVLLIIGLAIGMLLPLSSAMVDSQKRQTVRTTLSTIDAALVNYVAQNQRLPCPANGTIASGQPNAGVAIILPSGLCSPAPSNQASGVVPWATLGLPESAATDPWNARITYRVFPPLAMIPPALSFPTLMNMSACDPAGSAGSQPITCTGFGAATGCTQCTSSTGAVCTTATLTTNCVAPTPYLANKGLPVSDGNGNWLNQPSAGTGAAYVTISAGPSGRGAYNSAGNLQPGTAPAGANELLNLNNTALMTGSGLAQSYRDAPLNDRQTAVHFDDYLSHPTVITVLQNANLGPRLHQ